MAERATVVGWCRAPESEQVAKCRVELIPGDIVISQELLIAPLPPEEPTK